MGAPIWTFLVSSGALGTLVTMLYRQYRRSAGRELQPFQSYVVSSIRLALTRRLRPALAGRFGIRSYAEVTLADLPGRLPIPSRRSRDVDIEKAYIRLSLSSTPHHRVDDESLLDAKGSIMIFGEPGSGKTSLTRKLHRDSLKAAYLAPFRTRLPLRVELSRLPWDDMPASRHEAVTWLGNILRGMVSRVSRVHDASFVFDSFANGPGLVLFFDGLDEVPSQIGGTVQLLISDAIEQYCHQSTHTLVVVTARTQLSGVLSRRFMDDFHQILTVSPFTQADIFSFLRRWEFPPGRRLSETHRIFDRLRNNATLTSMCTNPLVLAMYVAEEELQAEDPNSVTRLADTRARFYDQVVGELLFFRRQDQRRQENPEGLQLLVSRQELLGRIALDHLLESGDPANVVSLSRASALAMNHWRTDKTDAAQDELALLAVESGLLTVQRQGESLRFIHLSICEYLAGKELAERDEEQLWGVLARVAIGGPEARRLWETAIFAVALSKRATRELALRRLSELRAPGELIMRIAQETKAYDSPIFSAAIATVSRELSAEEPQQWDSAWLAQVRLVLSCLSEAHRLDTMRGTIGAPTVSQWLIALVDGSVERLDRVFDLYLAESPGEALRVASESQVTESLFTDPDRIVAALENPELIILGMRAVTEQSAHADKWIDALAEAALRHELVAQTLHEEKIPTALQELTRDVDRRFAWHSQGPVANTFLGGVLAGATARASAAPPEGAHLVGRVAILGKIRPSDADIKDVREVGEYAFIAGASIILFAVFAFLGSISSYVGVVPALLLALLALIGGSFMIIRAQLSRRYARSLVPSATKAQILNLAPRKYSWRPMLGAYVVDFPQDGLRLYTVTGPVVAERSAKEISTIWKDTISGTIDVHDKNGKTIRAIGGSVLLPLIGIPPLVQAMELFRSPRQMWSVPIEKRLRRRLFRHAKGNSVLPTIEDKPNGIPESQESSGHS